MGAQNEGNGGLSRPPAPEEVAQKLLRRLGIWNVGVDKLRPSAFQPRNHFDKEKLEELAQSLKTKGILQPIVARQLPNGSFEIIAGERRWRAAQMAGLHEVPVVLKKFTDKETLELAIIENIQREDLSPVDEARAYQRLVAEFQLTQAQIAERVGKDRVTVAHALRLLQLPQRLIEMIEAKKISAGHAKVLLSLSTPEAQIKWGQKVADKLISVRQLEQLLKAEQQTEFDSQKQSEDERSSTVTQKLVKTLSEELQKKLGTRVQIDYRAGRGKVSINFYSDDELSSLVEKIRG